MIEYRAISLFSGAGGMDIGFKDAGFKIEVANELDRDAVKTFQLSHPNIPVIAESIDEASTMEQLADVLNPDIVFGGPPCQGFSVAGKMDPNDTRSELIWKFFDVVESTQPATFVCENVKALATNARWASIRAGLLAHCDRLGYAATIVVLNASDFGVPQNRERMFLIGLSKKHLNIPKEIKLNEALSKMLAGVAEEPPKLIEIIKSLGRAGTSNNSRICNAKITYAKNPVLRPSPYAGMMFNGAGRPVNPQGYSCTLPASMGGNKTPIVDELEVFEGEPSYVIEYHSHLRNGGKPRKDTAPERLRRLTIDECLAIQTFPKDFKLSGGPSSMYRQIGNAVPCKLANAVAVVVKNILDAGGMDKEKSASYKLPDDATAELA